MEIFMYTPKLDIIQGDIRNWSYQGYPKIKQEQLTDGAKQMLLKNNLTPEKRIR